MDPTTFRMMMGAAASSPVGQALWAGEQVNALTASFVVPANVFKLCAVVVGPGERGSSGWNGPGTGGRGGRGSDLRSINDLPVVPGETLTISIAASSSPNPGARILRGSSVLLSAIASNVGSTAIGAGPFGGTVGGGNGGNQGFGPDGSSTRCSGGGGAGGYSGNGGRGADAESSSNAQPGQGGGGAGGNSDRISGQDGGNVGLGGEGPSGTAPSSDGSPFGLNAFGGGGAGDTGGQPVGGWGGIRIIWGDNRAFPSTRTADEFQ